MLYFQVKITAVDIDPAMLEVATDYFDLVQDEKLDVYIRDGTQFIHQAAEKGWQALALNRPCHGVIKIL